MKIIYEKDKKIRLDKFLSSNLSFTRNKITQFINSGQVKVNGAVVKKAANLIKFSDEIIIDENEHQAQKKFQILTTI